MRIVGFLILLGVLGYVAMILVGSAFVLRERFFPRGRRGPDSIVAVQARKIVCLQMENEDLMVELSDLKKQDRMRVIKPNSSDPPPPV